MVSDASASIFRPLRYEGRNMKICNDITVPRIEGANKKKHVIWNAFLGTRWNIIRRERADQIGKDQ